MIYGDFVNRAALTRGTKNDGLVPGLDADKLYDLQGGTVPSGPVSLMSVQATTAYTSPGGHIKWNVGDSLYTILTNAFNTLDP